MSSMNEDSTKLNWDVVMPCYRAKLKEWTIIPSYIWLALLMLSIYIIFDTPDFWMSPDWWIVIAVMVIVYSSGQLGSREGNIDGFMIGYEWAKYNEVEQIMQKKQ